MKTVMFDTETKRIATKNSRLHILLVIFTLCIPSLLQAQQVLTADAPDCYALVAPRYSNDTDNYNMLAPEKIEWCCTYAANAFYLTNRAPKDMPIHDISDVVCFATGQHLPTNYVVDLNTFSIFGYNFTDFNYLYRREAVCFRVGNAGYPYLVMRSLADISNRVSAAYDNGTTYSGNTGNTNPSSER